MVRGLNSATEDDLDWVGGFAKGVLDFLFFFLFFRSQ